MLSKSGIIDNEPKTSDTAGSQDIPGPVQELIKSINSSIADRWEENPIGKRKLPTSKLGLGVLN